MTDPFEQNNPSRRPRKTATEIQVETENNLTIQKKIRILRNNFAKEKGNYPTILWINPADFLELMKSYEPYLSPERTLRNYFMGMNIIIVNVSGLSFLAVGNAIMTPTGWYPRTESEV